MSRRKRDATTEAERLGRSPAPEVLAGVQSAMDQGFGYLAADCARLRAVEEAARTSTPVEREAS